MRRIRSASNLTRYVDEIKHYFQARRQLQFEIGDNNDNQPLKDFDVPSDEESHTSIFCTAIAANNFELKPSRLQIVRHNQFTENLTEDSNLYLFIFVQLADTLKGDGVNPEAIRLRLFPFSLRERAIAWL